MGIKETFSSTFSMKKTYEIYKGAATNGDDENAKPWAMVRQQDWNLPGSKKTIYIDVPESGDTTTIETKIGDIDKKWGMMDNYGVRVACQADEVELLLCAIIIDQIFHNTDDDI